MIVIKKILAVLIFACIMFAALPMEAHAMGIPNNKAFDNLSNSGKYLDSKYRNNYYLDIEELGILDSVPSALNGMANILFKLIYNIAYIAVFIFNLAMGFDVSVLFAPQIGSIQRALHSGVFQPLLTIGIIFTGLLLIKGLVRRDTSGIIAEIGKIIGIIAISYFAVNNSAEVLSGANSITKNVGLSIITSFDGGYDDSSYSTNVAGTLWDGLLHQPYVSLQFGGSVSDDIVDGFLKNAPGSDARKQAVKDYMDIHEGVFDKTVTSDRISLMLIYIIPLIAKCLVYIFAALLQMLFQVMAVFYVLLAPIMLILALIPFFGGTSIISVWIKKMLETQLSILVITMIIGLIVWADETIYTAFIGSGWLMVILIQAFMIVGLFLGRNQILSVISGAGRSIHSPGHVRSAMIKGPDAFDFARGTGEATAQAYKHTAAGVGAIRDIAASGLNSARDATVRTWKKIPVFNAGSYSSEDDSNDVKRPEGAVYSENNKSSNVSATAFTATPDNHSYQSRQGYQPLHESTFTSYKTLPASTDAEVERDDNGDIPDSVIKANAQTFLALAGMKMAQLLPANFTPSENPYSNGVTKYTSKTSTLEITELNRRASITSMPISDEVQRPASAVKERPEPKELSASGVSYTTPAGDFQQTDEFQSAEVQQPATSTANVSEMAEKSNDVTAAAAAQTNIKKQQAYTSEERPKSKYIEQPAVTPEIATIQFNTDGLDGAKKARRPASAAMAKTANVESSTTDTEVRQMQGRPEALHIKQAASMPVAAPMELNADESDGGKSVQRPASATPSVMPSEESAHVAWQHENRPDNSYMERTAAMPVSTPTQFSTGESDNDNNVQRPTSATLSVMPSEESAPVAWQYENRPDNSYMERTAAIPVATPTQFSTGESDSGYEVQRPASATTEDEESATTWQAEKRRENSYIERTTTMPESTPMQFGASESDSSYEVQRPTSATPTTMTNEEFADVTKQTGNRMEAPHIDRATTTQQQGNKRGKPEQQATMADRTNETIPRKGRGGMQSRAMSSPSTIQPMDEQYRSEVQKPINSVKPTPTYEKSASTSLTQKAKQSEPTTPAFDERSAKHNRQQAPEATAIQRPQRAEITSASQPSGLASRIRNKIAPPESIHFADKEPTTGTRRERIQGQQA